METRRAALEKCLNKIANHPVLALDPDLRLFLESESFEYEVSSVFGFWCVLSALILGDRAAGQA